VDIDRTAVGRDHPGQNLYERALAGSIGPQKRMDLTRVDCQVDRAKRHDAPVALGHAANRE
jgi:hypothetical protein